MNNNISLQLTEIHKLILSAMFLTGVQTKPDLDYAIHLLNETKFDYVALFNRSVNDRVTLINSGSTKLREFSLPNAVGVLTTGNTAFIANNVIKNYKDFLTEVKLFPIKSPATPSNEEINEGIAILKSLGLIHLNKDTVLLTEEGKKTAEKIIEGRQIILRSPQERRTSIFIASAFGHKEIDLLYKKEFETACKTFKYDPFRVDLTEPSQTITDAIIRGISEARCIIADLTYARQSVYFEAGFAYGLGVPLILTCRHDHHKGLRDELKVHFDLEQYKISYWKMNENEDFSWVENMRPVERLQTIIKGKSA